MNDLQINTIRLQSGATILISDEMLSSFPSRISCIAKSDRASTFTIRYELKLHFINISLLNIFCFAVLKVLYLKCHCGIFLFSTPAGLPENKTMFAR